MFEILNRLFRYRKQIENVRIIKTHIIILGVFVGRDKHRGVEKRKFQRLEVPLDVTVRILTDDDIPDGVPLLELKSRDISMDGICLETPDIVAGSVNILSGSPGAREHLLDLEIGIISGEARFKAKGEVCWYDIARDVVPFIYQVGVVFIEIENSGKKQLESYLKELRTKKSLFKRLLSSL